MNKVDINSCKPCREGTHATFISSENRCKHIGKNPNGNYVRQFKVDGDVLLYGTPSPRCDYLLLNDTEKRSYYIELKGSDLLKAIQQVDHTIALISHSIPEYRVFRRIVYSGNATHKIQESAVVKWKIKYKGSVQIQRTPIDEIV